MSDSVPKKKNFAKPFKRKQHKPRVRHMIAYDLETTNIATGTPKPLYVTAFAENFIVAEKVDSLESLLEILATRFLIDANADVRFVGWNANNFDVYLIAMALLLDNRYEMRPYLTRSKSLRGMRVVDMTNGLQWEFLDGMAMTGSQMTLEKFLSVFAPDYKKMKDVIDFDAGETFDASKQSHCEYAMRDSVGLYWGLQKAESIVSEIFNMNLQPTIGNMGIKIFQSYMPRQVICHTLASDVEKIMRDYVVRGGFCFCARQFTGKIWSYDINQAYAAAMRETWLPDGTATRVKGLWERYPGIYRLSAKHPANKIPFYYRDNEGDAVFGMHEITDTWLTSTEVLQLKAEGWQLKITDGYLFSGRFRMTEYVDKLEHTRINADGGTSGPIGLMIKSIGNNSFGKTLEVLSGVEYVICNECPVGFLPHNSIDLELADLPIWERTEEPQKKDYHKPQIGAFVTAYVRMVLRRAALVNPDAWLYADTDGIKFTEPVALDIDPKRYGAWKVEVEGERYRIIAKKVYGKEYDDQTKKYAEMTKAEQKKFKDTYKNEQHSKGMSVKKLTSADFAAWSKGDLPEQKQLHRNNLMKVLGGAEMYVEQLRKGTKIKLTK